MADQAVVDAIDTTMDGAADAFEGILGEDTPEEGDEQQTGEEGTPDEDGATDEEVAEEDQEEQEPVYTVRVNGQEQQVPASELVKGYQLHSDYTRKTQELAEQRKAFDAENSAVKNERAHYGALLEGLQQRITAMTPQINWEQLRQTNPIEFAAAYAEHQMRQQELATIQQEQERLAEIEAAEETKTLKAKLQEEGRLLVEAIPAMKDPAKAKQIRDGLREFGVSLGFSPDELDGVYDHRVVKALYMAQQFSRVTSKVPDAKRRMQAAPVLKPGAARPPTSEVTRMKQRLAKTGSVNDAASLFESMI